MRSHSHYVIRHWEHCSTGNGAGSPTRWYGTTPESSGIGLVRPPPTSPAKWQLESLLTCNPRYSGKDIGGSRSLDCTLSTKSNNFIRSALQGLENAFQSAVGNFLSIQLLKPCVLRIIFSRRYGPGAKHRGSVPSFYHAGSPRLGGKTCWDATESQAFL